MKNTKLVSLIILFALVTLAFAGKKNKDDGKPRPQQEQAPLPPAGPQPPSGRLSQFFGGYLNRILGPLDQQAALPRTELTQLRESFVVEWAKALQPEKGPYQAAVTVCDALSAAMDEREKAIASLQGSTAVNSPSDLGALRKDNPTWKELRRDGYDERNRRQQPAQNDSFFSTQLKTNWTRRAFLLRQDIDLLSSRERDAERAAQKAKAAPPPPTPGATPQ